MGTGPCVLTCIGGAEEAMPRPAESPLAGFMCDVGAGGGEPPSRPAQRGVTRVRIGAKFAVCPAPVTSGKGGMLTFFGL